MAANELSGKPTVYRWADVEAANRHFENMHSWFRACAEDHRIITGDAQDGKVWSEEIDRSVEGVVPRHLLMATDEDYDTLKLTYGKSSVGDAE